MISPTATTVVSGWWLVIGDWLTKGERKVGVALELKMKNETRQAARKELKMTIKNEKMIKIFLDTKILYNGFDAFVCGN